MRRGEPGRGRRPRPRRRPRRWRPAVAALDAGPGRQPGGRPGAAPGGRRAVPGVRQRGARPSSTTRRRTWRRPSRPSSGHGGRPTAMDRGGGRGDGQPTRADDLLTELRGQLVDVESAVADGAGGRRRSTQHAGAPSRRPARRCRRRRADEQAARKALDAGRAGMAEAESDGRPAAGRCSTRPAIGLPCCEPPAADRADLAAAWRALDRVGVGAGRRGSPTSWRAIEKEAARARATARAGLVGRVVRRRARPRRSRSGGGRLPRDAAIEALADAKADVASIEDAVARLAELDEEVATLATTAEVAAALGRHLGAKGFEKWVLDEALDRLVAGATRVLLRAVRPRLLARARRPRVDVLRQRPPQRRRPAVGPHAVRRRDVPRVAGPGAGAGRPGGRAGRGRGRAARVDLPRRGLRHARPRHARHGRHGHRGARRRGRMVGVVSHVAALAERMPVRFVVTQGPDDVDRVERVDLGDGRGHAVRRRDVVAGLRRAVGRGGPGREPGRRRPVRRGRRARATGGRCRPAGVGGAVPIDGRSSTACGGSRPTSGSPTTAGDVHAGHLRVVRGRARWCATRPRRVVAAEVRRGLFSTAAEADPIVTRHGRFEFQQGGRRRRAGTVARAAAR